jgi:hypothetical protein
MAHASHVDTVGTVEERGFAVRPREAHGPAYQAYQLLHWGFVALPVIAGADKFLQLLARWEGYLAPQIAARFPNPHVYMMIVGVVEMLAGLIVALKPRIGAYIVAIWLAAIIVNLFLRGAYYDVALRDFGLILAALALARLSVLYDPPLRTRH